MNVEEAVQATLALPRSKDPRPLPSGDEGFFDFNGERIAFSFRPPVDSSAVVLFVHGWYAYRLAPKCLWGAAVALPSNYGVFSPDLIGHGHSSGEKEMSIIPDRDLVIASVEHVKSMGYEVVSIVAHSKGACASLLAAPILGIPTMLLGCRNNGDLPENLPGRDIALEVKFEAEEAAASAKGPLHLLHAADDAIVPVTDAHEIAKAAGVTADVVESGGHGFSGEPAIRRVVTGVLEFVAKHATL